MPTIQELLADAGLDPAVIESLAKNDKITARLGGLTQKSEYDQLLSRSQALEAAQSKSKTYQDWYEKNLPAIQKLQSDVALYQERYGTLDEPVKPQASAGISKDDVLKIVQETIGGSYAPQWSNLLEGVGTVVQRHVLAGRKTPIDFKKLTELAGKKGGDLMLAYDEYDAPERQAADESAREAEIKRRVDEQLKTEKAKLRSFPGDHSANHFNEDDTRSPLTRRNDGDKKPAYDRRAVLQAAADPEGEAERRAAEAAA